MAINAFQMHVSIPYFSNVPEDVVTNVWSWQFTTLSPSAADWGALRARLITFYNVVYGVNGFHIAPWQSSNLTRFKGYDLNDPVPRAPRYDTTTSLTVQVDASSTAIPELAVCLSFQGALLSGSPQSRRRGRVFLGLLGTPITAGTSSTFPHVAGTASGNIATAASALKTGAQADGWTWSVYSRTDNAMVTVTNGWIDNAPDIQRRRETPATVRTLWS